MHVIIPNAIKERRLLRLIYDGRSRTVEPHTLGLIEGKTEAMLCWQVSPPVRSGEHWHVFQLDKISGLRTLEEQFEFTPARQAPMDVFSDIHASQYGIGQQPSAESIGGEAEVSPREESPQ